MPKSKHRKKHKQALNKSKQPGGTGVLAQIVDSLMPVAPIQVVPEPSPRPISADRRQNRRSLKI